MADKSDKQDVRTGNTVGTYDGYQNLDNGLHYDHEGNAKPIRGLRGDEIQVDRIGVFERRVYADGTVDTLQVEPVTPTLGADIATPVPLPGEKQDQAGTGQTTEVKSDSPTTKASVKK